MYKAEYKPYNSDSESDSDTESESDASSTTSSGSTDSSQSTKREGFQVNGGSELEGADFRTFAENLLGQPLDGNALGDFQVGYTDNKLLNVSFPITEGGYQTYENLIIKPDASGNVPLKTTSQNVTNIIMVDSRDRDRLAYPQPTDLTLKLPRIYRNITGFQVVQMKLLSAFYYFRIGKQNIDINILEIGRTIPDPNTGLLIDNVVRSRIREGTYDINSLLTEISTQLNRAPIFYDFPNGFTDFAKKFSVTGDYSLNFNFPGENYYDSLLDQFTQNPTMDFIISKYFLSRYAGLSSYTTDQIKVAYYYPALKEMLLDPNYLGKYTLELQTSQAFLLPTETPYSRVVYTFQGINDPVILELINLNLTILDIYRLNHTFRYALINKYVVTYETQSNHVSISCPSLNTSLVNLLNYKQAQFFAEQLAKYGLTQAQYNALNTTNAILLAVITDMISYYQSYLATYFGIPFNTYSVGYLLNNQLTLPIRDGLNAIGVPSSYSPNLTTNDIPQSTDILSIYKNSAPQFWNRITSLSTSVAYMNPVLTGEDGSKATNYYTWNSVMDEQDTLHPMVLSNVLDPNNPNTTEIGNLYTNKRTQYADVIVPLEAAEYTVFRFKSPVRQTLRVETLPRPTKYRYPAYNAIAYDISHQQLFDASYSYVRVPSNKDMDVSSNDFTVAELYGIAGYTLSTSTAGFGANFSTSLSFWGASTLGVSVLEPRAFSYFVSPLPLGAPVAPAYKYPMRLTLTSSDPLSNFVTPLQLFLYQDRGGYMADISDNRNEKQIHYLKVVSSVTDASSVNLDFIAYADKTYYILTRPTAVSFASQNFRIVPSFPSTTNYVALTSTLVGFDPLADPAQNFINYNYAQVADPDFIQLPVQSTIYSTPTVDITFSSLTFSTSIMGYDQGGVSTDLTNYCGFISNVGPSNVVPTSQIRIDPANGYLFQAKSPYNSTTQNYLYSTSLNTILAPQGSAVYTPVSTLNRQQSIVHWYGNTFIPPSANQNLFDSNAIAATAIPPFTANYPVPGGLSGYSFYTRSDISGGTYLAPDLLNTGDGVMGIGFLPENGVWDIDRFMFKSIFTDGAADPNSIIRHIGIFPAVAVSNAPIQSLSLSSATAVLSFASTITYNSSNLNFGYDINGGTFYEFTKSSVDNYLYGYTQSAYEYNFDMNAYYIAVPFDATSTIQTFQGLVGSVVPYPLYSDVAAVGSVASPEGPLSPPNGKDIVLPNGILPGANPIFGPPAGYTPSQSQYEQSMAAGTNLLLYANPYPINILSNSLNPWTPFSAAPTELVTDCSGFILTKDSVFRVYSYETGIPTQTFTEAYQFTLDQVFPTSSNIDYLGVAANESNFAFFGLSNASPAPYLVIRTLNPQNGAIVDTFSEVSPIGFQSSVQLFKATYNNYGGYVMACQAYDAGSATTDISVVSRPSLADSTLTTFYRQTSQPNISYFQIGQSPKEAFGRFWVFPFRTGLGGSITEGIQDFAFVNPNDSNLAPPAGDYTAETAGPITTYATITQYYLSNAPPSTFYSPIVTRDVAKDRIFFLSQDAPTNFYEAPIVFGQPDPTMVISQYQFPSTPTAIYSGANGAFWGQVSDTLYGNRLDSVDGPKKATQAWQIFYPVHRIVFHQIAKNFTFLTDLSGLKYPEYPHTALAVYDGSGNFTADTTNRWGLESSSNFISADFDFGGFYFNAYNYAVPLQDNRTTSDFYYMSIRNYAPTEKSQVTLRLSAPNKYTYGYVTPLDISGEISTAKFVTSTNSYLYTYYWDPKYTTSLLSFDSNFIIDSNGRIFGSNVIEGYPGSNISSVTGFGDFYGRIQALYSTYSTQVTLASTINAATNSNVNAFILSDLQYIIPSSALNRQRFTDPLRFSIKWRSPLLPAYAALEEEWGLGWNLGYNKVDTTFETVHKAQSFFKIIDDYIYLRMNTEFDMNHMDLIQKENLSATQDSTGTTKAYYGKLLLANFGNYAQTMISNPITFANPLGKLDRLTFQWVDTVNAIIDNNDCEWNAVVQITEKIDVTTASNPPLINPMP